MNKWFIELFVSLTLSAASSNHSLEISIKMITFLQTSEGLYSTVVKHNVVQH